MDTRAAPCRGSFSQNSPSYCSWHNCVLIGTTVCLLAQLWTKTLQSKAGVLWVTCRHENVGRREILSPQQRDVLGQSLEWEQLCRKRRQRRKRSLTSETSIAICTPANFWWLYSLRKETVIGRFKAVWQTQRGFSAPVVIVPVLYTLFTREHY